MPTPNPTNRLIAVALLGLPAAAGAADVFVGQQTLATQRVSIEAIDHSEWDALLRQHVDRAGRVDYRGWKASPEASAALDRYLATLSTADALKPASREARLAFWINAYNAVTVKGILREFPTTSIRNHTAQLWGYNVWKNLKLYVGDQTPSLDEIEHQTLRPMGEPRIHFAIVCASIGCPRLLNAAYVAERLDQQLDTNARHFFAQRQNFRTDSATVSLSSILKWFGEDFGADQRAVLQRISPWLASDAARDAVAKPGVRVSYLDYDWNLNSQ